MRPHSLIPFPTSELTPGGVRAGLYLLQDLLGFPRPCRASMGDGQAFRGGLELRKETRNFMDDSKAIGGSHSPVSGIASFVAETSTQACGLFDRVRRFW